MPAQMADADHRDPHDRPAVIARRLPSPDNRDARGVGRRRDGGPIDQQRAARVDREHRRADVAHRLHGGHPTTGTSNRMSWFGFATLTIADAGTRQPARAADHLVGALHRFDRHNGAILHGDRLPDVEARHASAMR